MKRWLFLLFAFVLAACAGKAPAPSAAESSAPKEQPVKSEYPDLGPAPELSGDVWLNADAPLHLADLRGKVVLLDMWTFG